MKPMYLTQIRGNRLGLAINGLGDYWSKIFMCTQRTVLIIQRSIYMHGLWLLKGFLIPLSSRIIPIFLQIRKKNFWSYLRFQPNVRDHMFFHVQMLLKRNYWIRNGKNYWIDHMKEARERSISKQKWVFRYF